MHSREKALYLARALARRARWAPADLVGRLRGRRTPPRGLSFVGQGDFEAVGREFVSFFVEFGGLRPGDRVLDLGCGVGRMALPLTEYLDGGSYAGFDVGRAMIRWCRRHVTPAHPEFEFVWAPIYNGLYNPFGHLAAAEFRFPYEDSSFDFAFATSLFTHLLRADVDHYLAETARVLRPGGTGIFTFFLLDDEAERDIAEGRAALPIARRLESGETVVDRRQPEAAVAYRVEDVGPMLAATGLELVEPIHFGQWANSPKGAVLQDVVLARRPGA